MRILSLLLLAAASSAMAQAAPPTLSLTPELRIDARKLNLARDAVMGVGRDGRLIAGQRFGVSEIKGFDAAGRPLGWRVPTGRGDDVDIAYPTRMGWVGNTGTMWFNDVGYRQVALVDSAGKVTKSIEFPSWIHPTWAERRKYPVFGSMDAYAVYPDQSMLVIPMRERSFLSTPGYDRTTQKLLRTSWGGAIQRVVATLPIEEGRVTPQGTGCSHTVVIPFAGRTAWSVSADGMRVSIVSPGTTGPDSGTIRLIALNDRGDTTFVRRYPQPAVRVTPAAAAEFMGGIQACGSVPADKIKAEVLGKMPEFRSFVIGVTTGIDHSTWITMRAASDTATERSALVIDAQGALVGRAVLPPNQPIVAVDRDHLWTMELGRSRVLEAIVRYRVTPTAAPPARSAPASVSSRRARPPG